MADRAQAIASPLVGRDEQDVGHAPLLRAPRAQCRRACLGYGAHERSEGVREMGAQFGTGQVFWDMLWFFMFIIWIWLLLIVFSDIFRSHDMGGGAKTLWVLFVIFFPYLGVLVYLIARGGKMQERAARQAAETQKDFRNYVQETAETAGPAGQLTKLAELKSQGVISDAEFESMKAKIINA
jgi:hypothetical protein